MSSATTFLRAGLCSLTLLLVFQTAWGQDAPTPAPEARPKARARPRLERSTRAKTSGSARSTEKPDPKAKETTDPATRDAKPEEAPRGILGDTRRFTRTGGWGSIGGTVARFGLSRTALIAQPPIQEELKLTTDQKEEVKKWLDGVRKRGEEMGKTLRPQANDPQNQAEVPAAARILQFVQFMNQVSDMLNENESGLAKILKPAQRKRLTQISLQMEGVAAVARPEIAEALNLGPDQVEAIQQVLTQGRGQQMTTWIEQARASGRLGLFRRPNAAGPDAAATPDSALAPSPPEAQPTPAQPGQPQPSPPADPKARAEQQKTMRKQFESLRERTDRIQDQTVREILRLLTKKQRAAFDKMLGEPFDASKLNLIGRFDGGGAAADTPNPGK